MKQILLTTAGSEGITFKFDFDNILTGIEFNGATDAQKEWVGKHLPLRFDDAKEALSAAIAKGAKLIVTSRNMDFEADFYKAYPLHRDRFKAEAQWSKMTEEARTKAVAYLPKWNAYCKNNPQIQVKYPEQYLKQAPWND